MPEHAQERFLHRVFGVGLVAQDGEGDAIEGSCVLADQGRKNLLICMRTASLVHRSF